MTDMVTTAKGGSGIGMVITRADGTREEIGVVSGGSPEQRLKSWFRIKRSNVGAHYRNLKSWFRGN